MQTEQKPVADRQGSLSYYLQNLLGHYALALHSYSNFKSSKAIGPILVDRNHRLRLFATDDSIPRQPPWLSKIDPPFSADLLL